MYNNYHDIIVSSPSFVKHTFHTNTKMCFKIGKANY